MKPDGCSTCAHARRTPGGDTGFAFWCGLPGSRKDVDRWLMRRSAWVPVRGSSCPGHKPGEPQVVPVRR